MLKIAVIANAKSRTNDGWASCETLVRGRPNMEVYILGESPLDDIVKQAWARGCKTIVAAGGDGTISSVADALVRLQIPVRLGILPIGTLNHFAKDLQIPLDVTDALDVIESGHSTEIDVAKVNGRYFINNSSVGLYPYLLKKRQGLKRRTVYTKLGLLYAFISVFLRRFFFEVTFGKRADLVAKKTMGIFIGNNKYITEGFDIGTRPKLNQGTLFVLILKRVHVLQVLILFYKIFRGTALEDDNVNVVGLEECSIDSKKRRILVSYDGEVSSMIPPLHYSVVPKALSVIVPHL